MLRALRLCSLLVAALVLLAGCASPGSDTSDGGREAGTVKKNAAGGTTINLTFKGEAVTPQGMTIKVAAGKPITLHIVADKPGELHVHSSPEQELTYAAGTSEKTITLDQPGVVDMESHTLDKLVAQLEVR